MSPIRRHRNAARAVVLTALIGLLLVLVATCAQPVQAQEVVGVVRNGCFGPIVLTDKSDFDCPGGWRRGIATNERFLDPTVCWKVERADARGADRLRVKKVLGDECWLGSAGDVEWELGWPR